MGLTDKCKKDFEKWYIKLMRSQRLDYNRFTSKVILGKFYRALYSMQYGVCVDFFDGVGICVIANPSEWYDEENWYYSYECYERGKGHKSKVEGHHSLEQAREQAIIKANKIYNENIYKKAQ